MGESLPKLWAHQEEAIRRAKFHNNFALFFEAGTGKTRTALHILEDKYLKYGGVQKTLIFAPPVVLSNWAREIRKFTKIPPSDVCILTGHGQKRLDEFRKGKHKIYITNYETCLMKNLFMDFKAWKPTIIICDESHRLKSPQSKRSKLMAELADLSAHKFLLTGTPILNSPMDLFMQFRIMDNKVFGKNFFVFRSKYFYDKNGSMPAHIHFPDWHVLPKTLEEFNKIVHTYGAVAKKDECLDLPPLVRKRIEIPLSPSQEKMYKSMERDFIAFMDSKVAMADLAITKALRLMQIVTGFVTVEGEGNKPSTVTFKDSPRAEALESVLGQILETSDEKVIVWAVFHENYKTIREVCEKLKVDYVEVHGGTTANVREFNIEKFTKDPNCRVFIGHPFSGGIGVNLVEASYSIFFSRNFSLENDIQAEARNYRGGSERHKSVTRIDLVASGTIDELVLQRLESKMAITDQVLKDYTQKLKEK
jgi:SNF2 family DNA or RNA helicase